MPAKDLDPELKTMFYVQQGLITAMIAARFDPEAFERNIASVRGTFKLAALGDLDHDPANPSEQAKLMDQMFDLYVRMIRAGSTDPDNTP